MSIRTETRRRARTAQLLYAWELRDRQPLGKCVTTTLSRYPRCRDGIESAESMAMGVVEQVEVLDAEIVSAVDHWRLDRIGMMERSILRLGVFELRTEDVPPKVVISESVRLAHWFAGEGAPAFVNGVLDAVARRNGRL